MKKLLGQRTLVRWIAVILMLPLIFISTVGCGEKAPKPNEDQTSGQNDTSSGASTGGQGSDTSTTDAGQEPIGPQYKEVKVSISTDKGEIIMALRPDLMPITVENFMKLVKQGFYNGLTFHRVEDWVIQGGDPAGNGRGGPGWTIKLETSPKLKNIKYAVAMAKSDDPDSAGSQFYILKQDAPWLDGQFAVFGNVIKGQKVVDKIAIGDKMKEIKEVK